MVNLVNLDWDRWRSMNLCFQSLYFVLNASQSFWQDPFWGLCTKVFKTSDASSYPEYVTIAKDLVDKFLNLPNVSALAYFPVFVLQQGFNIEIFVKGGKPLIWHMVLFYVKIIKSQLHRTPLILCWNIWGTHQSFQILYYIWGQIIYGFLQPPSQAKPGKPREKPCFKPMESGQGKRGQYALSYLGCHAPIPVRFSHDGLGILGACTSWKLGTSDALPEPLFWNDPAIQYKNQNWFISVYCWLLTWKLPCFDPAHSASIGHDFRSGTA